VPAPHGRTVPDGIRFPEADLNRGLPPLNGDVDWVCAEVLEHLRDPDVLQRPIRSKMNKTGKPTASLPKSGNVYFHLNVLTDRFLAHAPGLFDRTHFHFYMWDAWSDLLNRNGTRTAQPVVIPLAWPGQPGLATALESLYSVAARAWKTLFAYPFIIVAEVQ